MPIDARIVRLFLPIAVSIATGAATWVDPPPATEAQADRSPGSSVVTPRQPIATAPPPAIAVVPPPQQPVPSNPQSELTADAGVTVAQWEFSHVTPGRPLYLSMTLDGTQPAIDSMRGDHPLRVEVHWVRENGETGPGAPNLVTELIIGRPGLASVLAGDVRRKGYFEWHSWARKDALSPGSWTASVTYPNGQPLLCGQDAQPCRFTIDVG